MTTESLFSRLATRLASSKENWATEALSIILESPVAAGVLVDLLQKIGVTMPENLKFDTQLTSQQGKGVADLVAKDRGGIERVIVEAKFWAGLTPNQPVGYLERLPAAPSALLFLVPEQRLVTLWSELIRLVDEARMTVQRIEPSPDDTLAAVMPGGKILAIVSWRRLLGAIADAVDPSTDPELRADIAQLRSLTETMDAVEIQPLSLSELGDLGPYRRFLQLTYLVDLVRDTAVSRGIFARNRLAVTHGRGFYGRYASLGNAGVLLSCDMQKWTTWRETPIWLTLWDSKFKNSPEIRMLLQQLEDEDPPRLFIDKGGGSFGVGVCLPLFPLVDAEAPLVVDDLLRQLTDVKALLESLPAATGPMAQGVPDPQPI